MGASNRTFQRLAVAGILTALASAFGSTAYAGEIGIDDRHGFAPDSLLASGSGFDTFRATIEGAGHNLIPLTSFEAGDLAGLDCLILNQPYAQNGTGYTPSEIAAIQAFVTAGGGMLVHGEGGAGSDSMISELNDLVAPYGIRYADAATESAGHAISGFVAHPVTTGLVQIGVDFQRRLELIDPPAIDLTVGFGADQALAVYQGPGGGGRIVFLSDSNIWSDPNGSMSDITFGDNTQLLNNIIDWIHAECFLVVARRPYLNPVPHQIGSHLFSTQVNHVGAVYPVNMLEGPRIPLSAIQPDPNQIQTYGATPRTYYFVAQVVMFNPQVFPQSPDQWSGGLAIYLDDGNVVGVPFGTPNGMSLSVQSTVENGETYIEFPFTVEGL